MAQRRYNLGRRGELADETRRRIVEATFALHSEQGIAATSMKQIAERAGVSIGTVYHHFPAYEDAIGACGNHTRTIAPLPGIEIFDGLETAAERVARLTLALFDWFERLPVFERVCCDQDLVPALRPYVAEEEQNRRDLVRAATAPLGLAEDEIRTAAAFLDMAVYRGLRRAGFSKAKAAGRAAEILLAWLSTHPKPHQE